MVYPLIASILTSLGLALSWAIEAKTDAPTVVGQSSAAPTSGMRALKFGTFKQPFAADSPWNAIPVNPVLDSYVLPPTRYYPFFGTGPYTTGVFEAKVDDPSVTVKGLSNPDGVWSTDDGSFSKHHDPALAQRCTACIRNRWPCRHSRRGYRAGAFVLAASQN